MYLFWFPWPCCCSDSLWLRRAGLLLRRRLLPQSMGSGAQAQRLWCTGLVAPWRGVFLDQGSGCVSHTDSQIHYHWATRESPLWSFCSLFCHSVTSDPLRPHGLQHVRLPCPSVSPRVCSNLCPLSQWYHLTVLSHPLSPPSPPALNLSQHQDLFQWVGCPH